MLKRLYISLIFSNLVVSKLLSYKVIVMHNSVTISEKFLRYANNLQKKNLMVRSLSFLNLKNNLSTWLIDQTRKMM